MAVNLKILLQVAPFPTGQREEIVRRIDELSDDQILRLSNAAWTALSAKYFARLKYETDSLLLEIQDGKKQFNQNDFTEIESKLTHEFAQKLQAAESQESISEIRQQLEKYKSKPLSSDHSSPTPPPQKS